jgi:F0F1-type ATP synthase delta subunit
MKIDKQISSWARAAYLAMLENPEKIEIIAANLKSQLGEKKKKHYPVIMKRAYKMYEKETTAELILSADFGAEANEKIKEKLKKEIKGIEQIEEKVDAGLIAGFRLKTKNVLIKASLKDILVGLKNKTYGHN